MIDLGGGMPRLPRLETDWSPDRHRRTQDRVWGVLARKHKRRRTLRLTVMAAVPALAAFFVWWSWHPHETAVLRPAPPTPPAAVASVAARPSVTFTEGATATILRPDTSLAVEPLGERGVRVALNRGKASFAVAPRSLAGFSVRTEHVFVEVLAAQFTVEIRGRQTWVRCEEGQVDVTWPGGSRTLAAGEAEAFSPAPVQPRVALPPKPRTRPAAAAPAAEPRLPSAPLAPPPSPLHQPPPWDLRP